MKLAFIHDDESWFWVLDESGRFWQCWHEDDQGDGNSITTRREELDQTTVEGVTTLMENIVWQKFNSPTG